MNIEDIDDIVFSLHTTSDRNQEINFKFIYNNYSENETQIPDDIIINRNFVKKNKFIRMEIENKNIASTAIYSEEFNFFQNNIINQLSERDLNTSDREFFNKIDNLIPHRKSMLLDNKKDDFEMYLNFNALNKHSNNIAENVRYDKSSTLSILNKENYEEKFVNKEYVENFNYNNIKDYSSLVVSNSIIKKRSQNQTIESYLTGNLLPDLNYISESINEGDINTYASLNASYCGAFLEKFKFNTETNDYDFLCARFYQADQKKDLQFNKIEDEAIKYGQTYRYVFYNVYFYTTVSPGDRFKLRHYLLCDYPYISNDIVCKEYDNPPVPVSLVIKYSNDDKKTMLTWEEPTNYEGDVTGYQIFKRYSFDEPFKLIKQLNGHMSYDLYEESENLIISDVIYTPGNINKLYFDEDFDPNRMCIYTIRSVDAHGLKSNYGQQIGVYYDYMRDKLITSLVAKPGASVHYPNETLENKSIFHSDIANYVDNFPAIYKPKKINLYLTPDFAYINSDGDKYKLLDDNYQLTITNLNDFSYNTDKFSIANFE